MTGGITEVPIETYDLLRRLGAETNTELREKIARGETVDEGARHIVVFNAGVKALYEGTSDEQALERMREANQTQCNPPYSEQLVRKHWRGALKWVAAHPSDEQKARAEARRVLDELHADGAPKADQGGTEHTQKAWPKRRRELRARQLSTVTTRRVEWAIAGVVPATAPTLLAGPGGVGKTGVACNWLAQMTRAGRHVLILSYEDATEEVLRPRMEAAGAVLDCVHVLYVEALDAGPISFPGDLGEVDRVVRETRAAALLIDPVSASLDAALDAHKDADVRRAGAGLAELAARERVAPILVAHLNKREESQDAFVRILGSVALFNLSRSCVLVTRDPAAEDRRLVTPVKSNYGKLGEIERWAVEPVIVQGNDGPVETVRMTFFEVADDVDRDDVLGKPSATNKLERAAEWLEGMLADGEWHDSAGLVKLARGSRISERTLRRAALEELHVEHERRGYPSTTWWRLPSHDKPSVSDLA